MPYLVIDADRAIVSGGMVATQAAADALALTDSGWTAHPGDVTGANFHANTEPGWFLTTAGATVSALPLSPLQELKNTMSEAHHYLVGLQADLHHEGSGRPWVEVAEVHDYCARVHQSNFRIVKENPQDLTIAKRKAYAEGLMAGPQNVAFERLTASELFNAIVLGTLTGQGVTYVSPETGAQLTIAATYLASSDRHRWGLGAAADTLVVTEVQLVSGLWTEGITPSTTD